MDPQNTSPQLHISESGSPQTRPKSLKPLIIGILLLILSVSIGVLYLGKRQAFQQPDINIVSTPITSPIVVPTFNLDKTVNWKTYENTIFMYKINYPHTWNFVEAKTRIGTNPEPIGGILIDDNVQKTTFITTETGNFQFTFEVKVSSNPANLSLDQWKNKVLNETKAASGVNLISSTRIVKLGNIKGYEFSIFGFDHQDALIGTIKNNLIYEVRFDRSNPNDPYFKTHSNIYQQMLASFTFLK